MRHKAVFLDRDRTILIPNDNNFIYRVGDFYIPDNFTVSLKELVKEEYLLFIVTNQGRVAKGYLTEEDVKGVHNYMKIYFEKHEIEFREFVYCPHNPGGHVHPYNVFCECRKPRTGLIEGLIERYSINRNKSWMVGDSRNDIIAGNESGLKTILVQTGDSLHEDEADFVEKNLEKAVDKIISLI